MISFFLLIIFLINIISIIMSSLSYQKSSNEYVAINMLQPKGNIDIFLYRSKFITD